jgi:hypothetical protein
VKIDPIRKKEKTEIKFVYLSFLNLNAILVESWGTTKHYKPIIEFYQLSHYISLSLCFKGKHWNK